MTTIEPPIIRPLVPATDADIALWEEIARKDPTIASTSAFMSLIARIKVELEKTIRECAEIAREGLVCRSCGHVGGIVECCDRMDFDGATHEEIAAGILSLLKAPSNQEDGK